MTIKHDQIIIVDIEATCWENNLNPPDEHSEIIEIGVCLLDTHTLIPTKPTSILVKPQRSKVSPFCTQLTTLTQEMVDTQGIEFPQACLMLEDLFESRNRLWCSWGNYDRRMFRDQSNATGTRYPFSDKHMNVRKVWAKYDNLKKQFGMKDALELLGLKLEGTHHRGGDDAWNIARILASVLTRHGIDVLRKYW